jgi:hypothetical protein
MSVAVAIVASRGPGRCGVYLIAVVMKLTNDCYVVLIGTNNFTERYYRDQTGWLKVSARGRKFRMTAEQVLNHLLPAVAGLKPNLTIKVEHHDPSAQNE